MNEEELTQLMQDQRDMFANEARRLRAENEKLRLERDVFYVEYRMVCDEECKIVHAENEKLRSALKPFSAMAAYCYDMGDHEDVNVSVEDLRAAAEALKETGNES